MRSQKLKRAITLEASVDAVPAHEKKRAKLKSPGLRILGKPKVGQRVRVTSNKDGLFEGGTIKEVFKRVQTHHLEYKLTICNDDGAFFFLSLGSSLSFIPQTDLHLKCVDRCPRRSRVSKFRCSMDPHKKQTVCE